MSIQDQIVAYARQHGIDPAYALAVAERESSFNPNAHASKTIYGLFQMSGAERSKYGVPATPDVDTQVRGFAAYTNGLKQDMTHYLGREPSPSEMYLGHYWGPARAAGVIQGHYSGLPARDVFTPRELAENPNLKPDKPVGSLANSIMNDMGRRYARFGGQAGPSTDVAQRQDDTDQSKYGIPVSGGNDTAGDTTQQQNQKTADFDRSQYGVPVQSADNETVRTAMSPNDLSAKDAPTQLAGLADKQAPTQVADAGQTAPIPQPKPMPADLTPAPIAPLSSASTFSPGPPPSPATLPSSTTADDGAAMNMAMNANSDSNFGMGDLGDMLGNVGKAMSQDTAPAAPKLTLNPDMNYLQQMALAEQANAPISGVSMIPGGKAPGSQMLPGANQQAPSYIDPRMFGIAQG